MYFSSDIFKYKFLKLNRCKLFYILQLIVNNISPIKSKDFGYIYTLKNNYLNDNREKSKDEILEKLYRLLDMAMMESDRKRISELIDRRLEHLESLELEEALYE